MLRRNNHHPSEGAARQTAVKMGSRWKSGAVPATV